MRRAFIVVATALAVGGLAAPNPAEAGGRGVAAGVVGGLAVGTLLGAAIAAPRYAPPPAYVVEPEPVYVEPAPRCYWTRGEPMWDGYRGVWVRPRMRVCD